MFPNQREFAHSGIDGAIEYNLGNDWASMNHAGDHARLLTLESFKYLPNPQPNASLDSYPSVLLIRIENGRGKYLKNGSQSNILAIIPVEPSNNPQYVQYVANATGDAIEISPYDNVVKFRITDENDNLIQFSRPYSIVFSITLGTS